MILIPQKLFDQPDVKVIFRDGNASILLKTLDQEVIDREGYVTNHVISILLEGKQLIRTLEGTRIKVNPGNILFIPRGIYYISDLLPAKGTFRSLLFYFDNDVIHQVLKGVNLAEAHHDKSPDHLLFQTDEKIQLFARSLLKIYQKQKLDEKQLLEIKTRELLLLLRQLAPAQEFVNFLFRLVLPKGRNITALMEQHYDKPLKSEDYAYLTGRSESTFRRDFKTYYKTTPQKWIKKKRIDKAIALMEKREWSVSQLAMEVGYENVSYFIREFRKKLGQSPKQYMLAKYRNKYHN